MILGLFDKSGNLASVISFNEPLLLIIYIFKNPQIEFEMRKRTHVDLSVVYLDPKGHFEDLDL